LITHFPHIGNSETEGLVPTLPKKIYSKIKININILFNVHKKIKLIFLINE